MFRQNTFMRVSDVVFRFKEKIIILYQNWNKKYRITNMGLFLKVITYQIGPESLYIPTKPFVGYFHELVMAYYVFLDFQQI